MDISFSAHVFVVGLNPERAGKYIALLGSALDGKPVPSHTYSMIGVEALARPELLIEISAVAVK
jgi:enamine deaminase RidA (YjgF/YER057c/UK114 family)